jgi:hypothetical protein
MNLKPHKSRAFQIILFLSIMSLSGCTKDQLHDYQNIYLEGYVLDIISGEPIENVEIKIYEWRYFLFYFLELYDSTSVYSDAEGHYKIEFKYTSGNQYNIRAVKELYFRREIYYLPDNRDTFSIYLFPQGFIKSQIKNRIPRNNADYIDFIFTSEYDPQIPPSAVSSHNTYNNYSDSILYSTITGGVSNRLRIYLLKTGSNITPLIKDTSFFSLKHDTTCLYLHLY